MICAGTKEYYPGIHIQEIIQPRLQQQFQGYSHYTSSIENYQYYWGKLQIKNRMNNAEEYAEWILSFTDF